jgi:hypothetical protein
LLLYQQSSCRFMHAVDSVTKLLVKFLNTESPPACLPPLPPDRNRALIMDRPEAQLSNQRAPYPLHAHGHSRLRGRDSKAQAVAAATYSRWTHARTCFFPQQTNSSLERSRAPHVRLLARKRAWKPEKRTLLRRDVQQHIKPSQIKDRRIKASLTLRSHPFQAFK